MRKDDSDVLTCQVRRRQNILEWWRSTVMILEANEGFLNSSEEVGLDLKEKAMVFMIDVKQIHCKAKIKKE